jgi:hypothetical protein
MVEVLCLKGVSSLFIFHINTILVLNGMIEVLSSIVIDSIVSCLLGINNGVLLIAL